MEDATVIAGLLEKRSEIEAEIAELERQVRQRQTWLRQLDSAISLFAPNLTRAKREVTRFRRSIHFATGELSRRVQTALREARGPITADEIAVQAMREKGLDMGDGELRQDITRRFLWTLNRMLGRSVVTKRGWGAAAKWERAPGTDAEHGANGQWGKRDRGVTERRGVLPEEQTGNGRGAPTLGGGKSRGKILCRDSAAMG